MQLRTAHDLGYILLDARRSRGWNQNTLAAAIGVSRQWVSMVENGKTSVEFDLVISALQALGYFIQIEARSDTSTAPEHRFNYMGQVIPSHRPSNRTPLTRRGKPLTSHQSRRLVG